MLASSHSSSGVPAIHMRLDSEGLALNDFSSISFVSSRGSMPNGRSACRSAAIACSNSRRVALQRSHVLPSGVVSLCQRIGSVFIEAFSRSAA